MNMMKRILTAVLAAALIFALAACGSTNVEETAAPEFVYHASYQKLDGMGRNQYFSPALVDGDGFYSFVGEVVGQRELQEGETLEYEGQLDIYENSLYRLGTDGSYRKLEGYAPMQPGEVEEGHTVSSNTNSLALLPDGGFLSWETVYENWSDAGDDVEAYTDEWYQGWQYTERYYLRRLDANGAELSCVEMDVEELKQGQDYIYFNDMAVLGENEALMAGDGGLFVFDIDSGRLSARIGGIDWAQNLLTLHDGRVAVSYYGDKGQMVSVVDAEKKALGESWAVQGDLYNAVVGGGDYDFYYTNGINFFGYKLETGVAEKLFNWVNCDVDDSSISGYTVTDDGKIVAISNEWDKNYENVSVSLITVDKVPSDTLPQKETLVFAAQYLDYYARRQIIDFNRKHEKLRIEVRDYSEYNTEDDYSAGLTKLRTEMLAGNCPDIISLDGLPAKQLAAKGLLTDLYPLLDADPELSREDFFPSLFKAMENEGKLYSTCSGFEIVSAVGASSVVGTEPGWTYSELLAALSQMPEDCTVLSNTMTRYDMLQICLILDLNRFVDWNSGKVSFDSPEFIELLNFVASFPAEFDLENYEWTEEDNDEYRIREGKQLLMYGNLYGFDSILQYENLFGGLDAFTFVGFPTSSGVGSMIYAEAGYAISEKCRNKEAAWEFVRRFLTEDYQNENTYYFPSNIHAYEERKLDAMTPTYVKDENGRIMLDPQTGEKMMQSKGGYWDSVKEEWVDVYCFTQEEIDKIEDVINSTERVYVLDESINEIVREQVEAFFAGQRSAEDVAKLIQSKAMIYVNEQR